MKLKNAMLTMTVAILAAGCSGSGPSDGVIRSCILDAVGFEALGVEQANVVMGMEIGRVVIDDIVIDNVIKEGGSQWLVYSVMTVGSRELHTTEADNAAAAQMFGLEQRNGFLLQEVAVDYLFSEGRNGWSCLEL